MKDDLGDRMKAYEDVNRHYLTRRMPCIIRCDGKSFHTLTADLKKPFDDGFMDTMCHTAKFLCENIQNAKMAYVQSDEISILLTDYARFNTNAWFDNNLQKMVSVSAALATLTFNKKIIEHYPNKFGVFDARAFVLPKEEVNNYFLWRQNDATRNSLQMLARSHFSSKSLYGLNGGQIQDKLILEKNINWNDTPIHKKRGSCIRRITLDNNTNIWTIVLDPPKFSQDKDYVNCLLVQEEE